MWHFLPGSLRQRLIHYAPCCAGFLTGRRREEEAIGHPTTWLNLTFSHLLSVSLVSYSIDRRTDRGHLFNVYPMNGSVFLLKSLDRETTAWHNISVVATELSKSSRVWDCLHCSCDILIKSKTVRGEAVEHSLPWRGSTTRIRPRSIAHWMGWLEVKPQSLHIYK